MDQQTTLGAVLKKLLDETGFYTRTEWAYFMTSTEAHIDSWVRDERVPTIMRLSMLLDLLQHRGGEKAQSALAEWERIAIKPIDDVVPILKEKRFDSPAPRTLKEYLEIRGIAPPREYQPFLEFVLKKNIYTDQDL